MRRVQQISEARAKANHRDATKSTGPRTVVGKTVSRLNAATHGVLSGLQVLPQVERQCLSGKTVGQYTIGFSAACWVALSAMLWARQ
jgi:hypothetical protein